MSLAASTSLWSGSSVTGAESPRETFTSTKGARQPATLKSISMA